MIFANDVLAVEKIYQSSAYMKVASRNYSDKRIDTLEKYLEKHNSPIAPYADELVLYADMYELDWRLVAAISGVESTFGKRIPQNSYNAYGWANGKYAFQSWEDSIEVVSRTLKEKYVNDGLITVNQISRRYAPPSNSWAWKVEYFMNDIQKYPLEFTI
jgi:hypothetical protein